MVNFKKSIFISLIALAITVAIPFGKGKEAMAATTTTTSSTKAVAMGENKNFENAIANYLVKNKGKTNDSNLHNLAHNAFNSQKEFAINEGKYNTKYIGFEYTKFDGLVYNPKVSINSLVSGFINKTKIVSQKNIAVYAEFYKDTKNIGVIRMRGVILYANPSTVLSEGFIERKDLSDLMFNEVSSYRKKKGLGTLKKVNTYDTLAKQYLISKIAQFPYAIPSGVQAIYAETTDLNTFVNTPSIVSNKWKGTNVCSVQVMQYQNKYYIVYIVKK